MNQVLAFSFEGRRTVRAAFHTDGTSWFVAKDIADALGYSETARALEHAKHSTVQVELNKINGLAPAVKWVPESDVYRMVMRSTLPDAVQFQDWLVEEVLPSIRKTGSYSIHNIPPVPMPTPQSILWQVKRNESKANFMNMMTAVEWLMQNERMALVIPVDDRTWTQRVVQHRKAEADLLNLLILGMLSRHVWGWYGIKRPIRDSLPGKMISAYNYLEGVNIPLMYSGLSYDRRKQTMEMLMAQQFPEILEHRDAQVALIERRNATKMWDMMPTHPMEWPQLHYSREYMLTNGFTQEQLDAADAILFAGVPEDGQNVSNVVTQLHPEMIEYPY